MDLGKKIHLCIGTVYFVLDQGIAVLCCPAYVASKHSAVGTGVTRE